MAIFDFELTKYFEGYRYITTMAKYLRTTSRLTRVKVAQVLNVPITTYRRLEEDVNFRNEDIIKLVANHFHIEMKIDYELISKVNDDFNEFYSSTYFGDIDYQEKMYRKLMTNLNQCQNSLLIIPMNLAKLVYYISNARFKERYDELKTAIDILNYFYENMSLSHKIIFNSYMLGYHSFTENKRVMEETAFKTLKMAEGDEFLKTVITYQMSLAYYIFKDWATSLYYAMKAIDGLVYTNNFNRLLYLKFSMSQIFYQLENYLEALDMLEKILVWTSFNNSQRLQYNCLLLSSYCLTRLKRYNEAKDNLIQLSVINHQKGELLMFMLYLCYKMNDTAGVNEQWYIIEKMNRTFELYVGYYNISSFIMLLKEKATRDVLRKAYRNLDNDFKSLPYCNLIDIIKKEYEEMISK